MIATLRRSIVYLAYAGAMLYATYTGFHTPYMNWDMLGYTGSIISWGEKDTNAIYDKTMAAIKANVPEYIYTDYKSNVLSAEAKAFVEQLPIYQVKPLYNAVIWLVHQFGMDIPKASWCVSASCFGMLSVLLFFWRPRYMAKEFWLLCIVGLTYFWQWPMYSLACLSTPDCIATLLEITAAFCWIMRRSFPLFCIFSWLALLARPDALILCGAWTAYFAVIPTPRERMPLKGAVVQLLVLCATYFTVSRLAGNYGLERWFIYAFIDKTPYPAEATDHLTLQSYWSVLAPSTVLFLTAGRQVMMLTFSAIALLFYYLRPADGARMWMHLLLLTWAAIGLRFLMFPAWGDDRYYFVYYLPILFAGGEMMSPYAAALWQLVQKHRVNVQALP